MPKFIVFLSALATLGLASCVNTSNVGAAKGRLSNSAGMTVATTVRPQPDFMDLTPLDGMGGAIGMVRAEKRGDQLVRRLNIQDPAIGISKDLSRHLERRFKIVPRGSVVITNRTTDPKKIAAAASGNSDLVLDVQTVAWRSSYQALKWTKYQVLYTVNLRLIDVKKQEMIAEGFYKWQTPKGVALPTHSELLANRGQLLRNQLDEAKKAATAHFRSQLLSE